MLKGIKPVKKPGSSVVQQAIELMQAFGRDDKKMSSLLKEMLDVQVANEKLYSDLVSKGSTLQQDSDRLLAKSNAFEKERAFQNFNYKEKVEKFNIEYQEWQDSVVRHKKVISLDKKQLEDRENSVIDKEEKYNQHASILMQEQKDIQLKKEQFELDSTGWNYRKSTLENILQRIKDL